MIEKHLITALDIGTTMPVKVNRGC